MPLDRNGGYVQIGYSEVECEWIAAANTLSGSERVSAFQDIADMAGRTYPQVRNKANEMRKADKIALEKAAKTHSAWRLSASLLIAHGVSNLGVSQIRRPTNAALMGGNGRLAKCPKPFPAGP